MLRRVEVFLMTLVTCCVAPSVAVAQTVNDPSTYCVDAGGLRLCKTDASPALRILGLLSPEQTAYGYQLEIPVETETGEMTLVGQCFADQAQDSHLAFHFSSTRWPGTATMYETAIGPEGRQTLATYSGNFGGFTVGPFATLPWTFGDHASLSVDVSFQFAGEWHRSHGYIPFGPGPRSAMRLLYDLCD